MMFWVHLDSKINVPSSGKMNVVRKGLHHRQRPDALPHVYFASNSKKVVVDVATRAGPVHIESAAELKTKKWHHVAVTADCIGVRLYVDGKHSASKRVTAPLLSNSDPFYVGRCPDVAYPSSENAVGFKGYLLDCRYYLRKLDVHAVEQYFKKCKPNEKKKPHVSRIQIKSHSKDPVKKGMFSLYISFCIFEH